jgi:hypothetical protein
MEEATYTDSGLEGLMKDGGTARQKAAEEAVKSVTATALALASNAGGGAHVRTTVLLTPAEVDQAVQKNVSYRPPGR